MSVDGAARPARARRARRRRRPVRRAFVLTHRWLSLVVGVLLLVVTVSGSLVLYAGEWTRWTNPEAFSVTPSTAPVSFDDAVAAVRAEHPRFEPGSVNVYRGLVEVFSSDEEAHPGFYGVDPGTGRVTGFVEPDRGFMGLMVNLHECGLTCEGHTGYTPFLADPVPWVAAHLVPDLTWGGLGLALTGLLLVFLAVSGAILWWPGIRRMSHGFRIRWRRSRYARDFDLHQVVGLAAVPFLLMWGLTGASFELPKINQWWYAATGGAEPSEDLYTFSSRAAPTSRSEDIGLDAAVRAAQTRSPGTPVYAAAPGEKGKAGYYTVYLSESPDPYRHGPYPGQVGVYVDRYDAGHLKQVSSAHEASVSNQVWDNWRYGVLHFGFAVDGWWRLVWFGFGMTPVLLAWTGMSTWLCKRAVRRRKRRARAALTPNRAEPALVPTSRGPQA